jgi:hypothetical protein
MRLCAGQLAHWQLPENSRARIAGESRTVKSLDNSHFCTHNYVAAMTIKDFLVVTVSFETGGK